MIYDVALYAGLIILAIGLVHRIDRWFLLHVGTGERDLPAGRRALAGLKGLLGTLFSMKILGLLKVLIVDLLFQGRILRDRKDPLVWFMHLCIFSGFILLLLFHALAEYVTVAIDPAYQSTLSPFLFLRNLFGFLLLVGLVLAAVRRLAWRDRIRTTAGDLVGLGILAVIALSGFCLEGLKITSHSEFISMVGDFGIDLSVDEIRNLQAYWVAEYGLVPPQAGTADKAAVAHGRAVHEDSCRMCHDRPQSAFVSYPVSRLIQPVAAPLDQAGGATVLWHVHVLSCCIGLAYLAFSRMFHVIGTPVSLILAEVAGKEQDPAAAATRQMIELDGCSHGGTCHEGCPVRIRRLERIDQTEAYEPMFVYLGQKSARDLGSREVSGTNP